MFRKHSESGYTPAIPGIEMKTLVYGEKTLMTEFIASAQEREQIQISSPNWRTAPASHKSIGERVADKIGSNSF